MVSRTPSATDSSDAPAEWRAALAAAYAELFASLAAGPHPAGRLHLVGETVCAVTPAVEEPGWALYLNQASGLGLGRPATEVVVDDVLSLYRAGRTPFVVAVDPAAQPSAIAGWLEARGLRRRFLLARCHRAPEAEAETSDPFAVEDAGPDTASTFADLAGRGLPASVAAGLAGLVGRPGWHHSIVREDGAAVAAGALFVHDSVACLCWSATRPGHRRRGVHAALIRHRLRQAAQLGCRQVVAETLEATDRPGPSLRNLLRAGFQTAPHVRLYVSR